MAASGRRRAPMKAATEVAHVVGVVTSRAERGQLAISPLLTGHPVSSIAEVTEPPCRHTTVNAWPGQHLLITPSQDLHLLAIDEHPRPGPRLSLCLGCHGRACGREGRGQERLDALEPKRATVSV